MDIIDPKSYESNPPLLGPVDAQAYAYEIKSTSALNRLGDYHHLGHFNSNI